MLNLTSDIPEWALHHLILWKDDDGSTRTLLQEFDLQFKTDNNVIVVVEQLPLSSGFDLVKNLLASRKQFEFYDTTHAREHLGKSQLAILGDELTSLDRAIPYCQSITSRRKGTWPYNACRTFNLI